MKLIFELTDTHIKDNFHILKGRKPTVEELQLITDIFMTNCWDVLFENGSDLIDECIEEAFKNE